MSIEDREQTKHASSKEMLIEFADSKGLLNEVPGKANMKFSSSKCPVVHVEF